MDRQEQHHLKKEKQREQKKKEEKVYEDRQEADRLPVNSVWFIAVGIVLVVLIVAGWMMLL